MIIVNDFTKEELEDILFGLENSFDGVNTLIDKVKSMIENYWDDLDIINYIENENNCNHEFMHVYSNPIGLGDSIWICKNCAIRISDKPT